MKKLKLRLGIIFAVVSLILEIAIENVGFFIHKGLSLFSTLLLSLAYVEYLPFYLVSLISNKWVFYLSEVYLYPIVLPKFFGYLILLIFWFIIGALIEHFIGSIKKKQ